MTPFTFIDRAVAIRYYPEDPIELTLYLGDALDARLDAAVAHYDLPHTVAEDVENFLALVGRESGEKLLARAETVDRLTVLELLSYTVRVCREEQGKKLMALAEG